MAVVRNVANSETFKVTTPSDREIRLTRLFDAPRRLVFEAMTKPEHVRQDGGVASPTAILFRSARSTCGRAVRGASSTARQKARWSRSTVSIARLLRRSVWCSPRSSNRIPTPCRS